jgi:predicted nucleotide-binding protein
MNKADGAGKTTVIKGKRSRINPSEIPRHSLREALTIAQALSDNFGGQPASPLQVAMSLDKSPTSSTWRSLTGAAIGYGLTSGGYNAEKISLLDLGRRATQPREEGDDIKARAEAALKPKVLAEFFTKYNRSKFPPDKIAQNVLMIDLGVPPERVQEVLDIIKDNGAFVGFLHETKTGTFVSIDDLKPSPVTIPTQETDTVEASKLPISQPEPEHAQTPQVQTQPPQAVAPFRVFITHGKNMSIVEQVKDVLDLYDIEYEVAVEEETTAIPVPQKVLSAMRRCQAGIMVVCADDDASASTGIINNNVLIEIGTAFVLYDQKVVLLWDKQLKVPSNLQGLYRCEFEGGQLSFATGTRLAKAVKGFRK